jgi:hypothetical protein
MGRIGKKRNISCLPPLPPMQGMGVEIKKGSPHLLVLNWRAGGIRWPKIKDSG